MLPLPRLLSQSRRGMEMEVADRVSFERRGSTEWWEGRGSLSGGRKGGKC